MLMDNIVREKRLKHFYRQMADAEYDDEIADQNFDFSKERRFIADKYGYKPWEIEFDLFHPCGEVCIFAKGRWMGYVDEKTEEEMKEFYSKKA